MYEPTYLKKKLSDFIIHLLRGVGGGEASLFWELNGISVQGYRVSIGYRGFFLKRLWAVSGGGGGGWKPIIFGLVWFGWLIR